MHLTQSLLSQYPLPATAYQQYFFKTSEYAYRREHTCKVLLFLITDYIVSNTLA